MITKADRTCDQCGKVAETPWGLQVHKGRMHGGYKKRRKRSSTKVTTNGTVPSSLMVMYCPGCGFPIHRLRVADDVEL